MRAVELASLFGFFVVEVFIFAVSPMPLASDSGALVDKPVGFRSGSAVEGLRRCRVVVRVDGDLRNGLWPLW